MRFFFADDSQRSRPSRPGMGSLIGIGGICVEASKVKTLTEKLEGLCLAYGFPSREEFKWSPGRELWMRDNLVGDRRKNFFIEVLDVAKHNDVNAIVVIEDKQRNTATNVANAELDVIKLFFERVQWRLCRTREEGVVIIDRPSGDRAAEDRFLYYCLDTLQEGTEYLKLEKIVLNALSVPSKFTRLLQLADLVTSCTLAFVAGEDNYSPPIFEKIKKILCSESGRMGGIGLKIHPDYRYVNLYHWLVQDSHYHKRNVGIPLPIKTRPYNVNSIQP